LQRMMQRFGYGEGPESVSSVLSCGWSVANSSRLWVDCSCIVGVGGFDRLRDMVDFGILLLVFIRAYPFPM
jgi:hypothetical protein